MHLLLAIQPQHPEFECPGVIDKFLKHIISKQYSAKHVHPNWNRIRPREIRLFDLVIPEKIEKEVIEDLQAWENSKIARIGKLLDSKIVGSVARKILGLEKLERGEKKKPEKQFAVYLSMLGKVPDDHINKIEQL